MGFAPAQWDHEARRRSLTWRLRRARASSSSTSAMYVPSGLGSAGKAVQVERAAGVLID
jgi:hypothetical protein